MLTLTTLLNEKSLLIRTRKRLPSVVAEAQLNPVPIRKRQGGAEGHDAVRRYRPGGAEQDEVQAEKDGRGKVESEVREERQCKFAFEEELGIDHMDSPVEDGDQDLERGGDNADGVLDPEQGRVEGQVCEDAQNKSQERGRQADDGEELEMPAVGLVEWSFP